MTESDLIFRRATRADLPDVIRLLADDVLGQARERAEDPLPKPYYDAFELINADPLHELIVVEREGRIVATMHLMVLISLTKVATPRLEVEAVRVLAPMRGQRIGERMMRWAINRPAQRGCGVVQLTTDARRLEAHAFYKRLGFAASHVGMKLIVKSAPTGDLPHGS